MQVPLQITIRDIPHSPAVEKQIMKWSDKLEQYSSHIISCRVVVEFANKNHQNGKLYQTNIDVTLPKQVELISSKQHENMYQSIHEAFFCMLRQIDKAMGKMSGETKSHPVPLHGTVARIFGYDDFGFIETSNGTEYYFNSGNVSHPSFDKLNVGDVVEFIEKVGFEGPQAHRVKLVRREQEKLRAYG